MNAPSDENFEFKQFVLAAGERLLLLDGKPIDLTPKAFDLLLVLVRNGGHLVSKDQLLEQVWPDSYVEEVNLTVNISALRRALGDDQIETKFIETVPKRGYRFVAPVKLIGENALERLLNPSRSLGVYDPESSSNRGNGSANPTEKSGILLEPINPALVPGLNRFQDRVDLVEENHTRTRIVTEEQEGADRRNKPEQPDFAHGARIVQGQATSEIIQRPATRPKVKAEQFTGAIQRHQKGVMLVVVLVIVTAGIAFLYSNKSGKPIDSVAVLPFINVTGDPNTEYLSNGISESLINSLSQLPQLKVIARSSSAKYKNKDVDIQEVANALGVQAIVTGRILQRGDQLQISVEMVNARDKTQMWGAQYSRQAADFQAVQEEIARTISEKLRVRLTGAQEQQITKRATENPEAYQLYLNGVFYGRKGGTDEVKRSLEFYQQAIARDQNFALAYVGMAESYTVLVQGGVLDPKEGMPKRKAAVQKALELDETLADAHVMLASLKGNEWDWSGAEIEYKQAIALNPNLSLAHAAYGNFLGRMGRYSDALVENKRAQEIDPMRVVFYRILEAGILRFARRYDEALQKLQDAVAMQPNISGAHSELGYIYAAKGMYKEAIDAYQKSMSMEGENTSDQVFLGFACAMLGKRNEALSILHRMKSTKLYVSPAELAILYVGLGDKEEAFKELERAYAAHDLQLQYLKVDAHYDSLRSDARFTALIRRVGLPES